MENKKIVSFDFDVLKQKALTGAKDVAKTVGGKLSGVGQAALGKAKNQQAKAMSALISKGIQISEKQLKALEAARKSYT